MKRFNAMKKKQKFDSVAIYTATREQYNALKDAALQTTNGKKLARAYSAETQQLTEDGTVHISGNDAHLAWLGNTLKAKLVMQMMNARGANPKTKGDPIPENYLGNALLGCGANSRKGDGFDAMDFRKAVKLYKSGNEGVTCCTHGCIGYPEFLLPTSWAKIQHKPKFGTRTGCYLQFPHVGEWFVYAMNVNVHCQANDEEHMFIQTSLSAKQADSLRKACDANGFVCTVLSAQDVMKYWSDDPTKIHG